jgi:hypothetical protein
VAIPRLGHHAARHAHPDKPLRRLGLVARSLLAGLVGEAGFIRRRNSDDTIVFCECRRHDRSKS